MTPEEQQAHNRASRRFRQWLASPEGQRCRADLRATWRSGIWFVALEFMVFVILAVLTVFVTVCLMAW